MTYSLDLRERAVGYVQKGGSPTEASHLFHISRKTLYNWLACEDLTPKKHGPRKRKLDKDALRHHVQDFPDALLRERAEHFGVHINAIWVALKNLAITKKTPRYKQRAHALRVLYLQKLRSLVGEYGKENIVYFDESGFKSEDHRPHGWANRGRKVNGNVCGNRRKTTNLIMAQRRKSWLAPMLFKASCTAQTVLVWMEKMLLKELTAPSVIIMDNAAFHNKAKIRNLLEKAGHTLLSLPPYSPDFNPIEQSFAVIKKRKQFFKGDKPLETILNGNL